MCCVVFGLDFDFFGHSLRFLSLFPKRLVFFHQHVSEKQDLVQISQETG